MKIAIVGFSTEGKSSYDYFINHGDHQISIRDANPSIDIPEGINCVLGDSYLDNLDEFDLIVRTPGIHPSQITLKNPGLKDKITTQINEFFKVCPSKNIIAVTGTKGKGTTSSLIAGILKKDNKHVVLGGNIGVPVLSMIDQIKPDSWVVLELSSFQLIDIRSSPRLAVCLMVVPEHLNWHTDMFEYLEAKTNLFRYQSLKDKTIFFAGNSLSRIIASTSPGIKIPYFESPGAVISGKKIVIEDQKIIDVDQIKLIGKHNLENVCAAVTTVWQVTKNIEAIKQLLGEFAGLEHRLELVRTLRGVRYYDDSFGTTPDSVEVAIDSFNQPKILIVGGRTKGVSSEKLARHIEQDGSVKSVIAIGETGDELINNLSRIGYINVTRGANNMKDIVNQAMSKAEDGDIVLLSPGFSSFDMFDDYKDRGNQFKAAVQSLF